MSDINSTLSISSISNWSQVKELEIQKHEAWHGSITAQEAENLLTDSPAFTYLLRKDEKSHEFFLSFMSNDSVIYHQSFRVEQDLNGWFYKNGDPHVVYSLKDLISMVMHCQENESTPLKCPTS